MKYTYRPSSLGGVLFLLALVLVAVGGWVANIVKLFGSDFSPLTGEVVLRVVGVFVAPLGAILGFL